MRKALAVFAALFAVMLVASVSSANARDASYRAVAIDTSRIAITGHRHLAHALKPMLAGELSKALGPRLGSRGGVLTVRITSMRLLPSAGDVQADAANSDRLEGVVVVPGRGAIPIRIQLPPTLAGAWYSESYNERRIYRLIEAFAQWAAREA